MQACLWGYGWSSRCQREVNANKLPRVKGEVEFKGISFSYNDEIKILKNINLKVNPGETVAFVGATGVGKSTIASLLNRFYDPQNGSILMDGIDIKDVTLKSLRDNISMVLQDTFYLTEQFMKILFMAGKKLLGIRFLQPQKQPMLIISLRI